MFNKLRESVWQVKSPLFGWKNTTPKIAASYGSNKKQKARLVNKYSFKGFIGHLNLKRKERCYD